MHLRRSLALTTTAVALATAVLSSCGFDAATERETTPNTGVNDRSGVVKVLAAVVVSSTPGSGTFVASLSNSSLEEQATMTAVSLTAGEAPAGEAPAPFEPVVIKPGALVNLADPAADIKLTGDFAAGDFVEVTISFENGETVEAEVPVVANEGYYADLDGPTSTETSDEATPADDTEE